MIITLTGFMGCGKSRVGRELATMTGFTFLDLDRVVTARAGRSIREIFEEGEARFREIELECLENCLRQDNLVLALGGGTITVPRAMEMILGRSVCVFLKADMETILERVGRNRNNRPLFDESAAELYRNRLPLYSRAHFTVVTDSRTPESIAMEIRDLVR